MTQHYYYFAATLPMLSLESKPPISSEAFRAQCRQYLSPADFEALEELMAPGKEDARHPFVRQWRNRDAQLRNALAKIRGSRLRRDASPFLKETEGFDVHAEKVAAEAYARKNPLERERALDHFRWEQIAALAGFDAFSAEAIMAYALHLKMAERWAAMDEAKGMAHVETIAGQRPEGK